MALGGATPRSRLNHYGPWALVGGVVAAVVIVEIVRKHIHVNSSDLIYFLVLVPTIILHEISHGVVAYWCGDDTAKRAKRLSLNPLRHIDPIGSVLVPIVLIATTGYGFGWAKPVPVNIGNLRHPRNQAVLVGLVGPATNLVIALGAGLALGAIAPHQVLSGMIANLQVGQVFFPASLGEHILFVVGFVNLVIAVFNLIPIPPLDGSALLERLLPATVLPSYYQLRQFSLMLVLFFVLFAPGALNYVVLHALLYWERLVF